MLKFALVLLTAAGSVLPQEIPAQELDKVVLKSGRVLVGQVVSDGSSFVALNDRELGAIDVPRTAVRAVLAGGRSPDPFAPEPQEDPGEAPETYVRWVPSRDGDDGGLETATSRWFDPATETAIFLVGVVHIADPAYYRELQKVLDAQDLVLFEGVGKGEASDEELASLDVMMRMQLAMRGATGLGFQKDHVDYAREWWVNSDVDYSELRAALRERSASLPTDHPVVARLLKTALSLADGSDARRSIRLQHRLKALMGPGLAQADAILQRPAFAGMRGAVIEHRNGAVMADLERTLAGGPRGRWIGIFYGAGHLPDFAARFTTRGLRYDGAGWHRAWRMPAREPDERFDRRTLDGQLRAEEGALSGARISLHLARVASEEKYGFHDEDRHDGASVITLAVELFAAFDGRLDEPRSGVPVRSIGADLLGTDGTRRAAAVAVAEQLLGGDGPALAKQRARSLAVGMRSLEEPAVIVRTLRAIAARDVRGVRRATSDALAGLLFVARDESGGRHGFTTGTGDGGARIDSGFCDTGDGDALVWSLRVQAADDGAAPSAADVAALRERVLALVRSPRGR
ncbi:MAG: hypothetical protein HZB39_21010 [Planctomycetes bacterium]|nr:hypothetical protein [Planctomycetota bacterium]